MEDRKSPGEVHNLPLEHFLRHDQRPRALRLPHRHRPIIRAEGYDRANIGGMYGLGRVTEEDVWVIRLDNE